jgi:1,4-dihydroxy-6-naphthoate synthase
MSVQTKTVTIAHSPDSDDAFMFYALAKDKIQTNGLDVKQVLKDIQSLNHDAINGVYEVSAISFAAYPQVKDKYALMPCGASMGYKYGPILIAKKPLTEEQLKAAKIAIPGKLTTAYLTLQLYHPGLNVFEVPFDRIIETVASGEADAGVIIHEGQLFYESKGMTKIVDLGEWWFEKTGLPLPLGGNVVRKDLGEPTMKELTRIFKQSIVYSLEHRPEALEYAMEFARDMKSELADKFVGMYVNELTVDYGESGRLAVKRLFEMAHERGIYAEKIVPEFVEI